ncbi:MAG TPA: hypothetical protein VMU59_08585, partial [Caulobacteraceae bacterium]|nr:hypothetical protein [Caulobacteraceae bacterium]
DLRVEEPENQPAVVEREVVVTVPQGPNPSEANPLKTLRGRTSEWNPPIYTHLASKVYYRQ